MQSPCCFVAFRHPSDGREEFRHIVEGASLSWFRKMDADRDGDISRRQFLGDTVAFRRIDSD